MDKQDRKINLILSTSEYSYPFRLEKAINVGHISNVIVAAELSPADSWKALVHATYPSGNSKVRAGENIIGMGPNLAELFISTYGGHLLTMHFALDRLADAKESFSKKQGFPGLVELQAETGIEVKGAKPYLSLMAKDGFAPLKKKDMNVAKQLSSIGLCGVVADSFKSSGVPRFLWEKGETSLGLIPSSQLTRLAIGKAIAAETFGWGRLLPWRWFKGK